MKKFLQYILIVLIVAACGTAGKTVIKKQDNNYKKEANTIHPKFFVFHVDNSISELYFKISSKELLYTRPDGINFLSNVLISYHLIPSYDSKEILDSASVRLVEPNNELTEKYLIGKINMKASSSRNYYLRVTVTDLNRNTSVTNVIAVDKTNDLGRQNFIVKSQETNAPLFGNYMNSAEQLTISYKSKISVSLFVRYYNRDFPLAAPPFSLADPKPFQYRPDSTYFLKLSPEGTVNFSAAKRGFYHIQLDTTRREGLTLFNYGDDFPNIVKAEEMIYPLRFITSKQEYDELITSDNKKAAVEKFWMNCTGNQDRAKEVIRKYYNRVQDANQYFTSYLEGWKTDRGMVYLIYGSPNVIYRTSNSETWIYGEENNINSISYYFVKIDNPFTDNDYSLERSAVYRQSWYVAVDIWRQGRTYLQD